MDSSLSTRSSSGSRQHRRRHGRRRRKSSRRERRHRRHQDKKDHHDCPSKSPIRKAAARAGIVSDEDGDRQHQAGSHPKGRKTEAQKKRRTSGRDGDDDEITYDDTIGHFQGQEGTVISNRYRIERQVGMGTFGRVVECLDLHHHRPGGDRNSNNKKVAIKIVRNVKRYYESALIEADIVEDVNRRGGRGRTHCAVMFDGFSFSGHYCMVFEKLGPSLYDFQKRQNYRPFPLMCVRDFAKQLLETLEFLHGFGLIHTDLKPENILLMNDREVPYKGRSIPESTRIKVIDFGAATYDNEKKSSVVNTRQYRAPEVILGVGWSMPSDLWSLGKFVIHHHGVYVRSESSNGAPAWLIIFLLKYTTPLPVGCILVELFQGELLFATHDNIEHLALIEQVVGPFPRRMIKRAKNTEIVDEAFDSAGTHRMERVLPPDSFSYVKRIGSLEAITSGTESWFLRLLRRILVTDPKERATARECLQKV